MDVVVRISTTDSNEVRALLNWLQNEDGFTGRVALRPAQAQPEVMGVAAGAILVTLVSAGGIGALAKSIQVWLVQRRSTLVVEIVEPDGSSMRVSVTGPPGIVRETRNHLSGTAVGAPADTPGDSP
jgi:hypothetical protein